MIPFHLPFTGPAVRQSPHEAEEEGNDQDGANEQHNAPPQSTTPSRLQRQPPSQQGRVAYVIYGGRGSEAGVYYNWYTFYLNISLLSMFIIPYRTSCRAVIQRYYHNSAPPYLGFNGEEHAQTSFAAFQASGQLPAGLFSPTFLRPLDDSPVPSSQSPLPLTIHHLDSSPVPSSPVHLECVEI